MNHQKILCQKQTKIFPQQKINEAKTVLKKLERGQKLNIKQLEIFQEILLPGRSIGGTSDN